jgi:hypothetical protein
MHLKENLLYDRGVHPKNDDIVVSETVHRAEGWSYRLSKSQKLRLFERVSTDLLSLTK